MGPPRRSDLVSLAAATTVSGVLVLLTDAGWAEWLFGTVMLWLLLFVLRRVVTAHRAAAEASTRARTLAGTPVDDVAVRAVAEERSRLATEVEQSILRSLRGIYAELERLDETDPVPALQRIHRLARQATSELRLQLGLLRNPVSEVASTATPPPSVRSAPQRRTALIGVGLVLYAAAESTLFLLVEGPAARLPWSVLTTTLAAAAVVLRATPSTALLAFAAVAGLGSVIGFPVTSGFWIMLALGWLLWELVVTCPPTVRQVAARLAVVVSVGAVVVWGFRRDDPDNLGVVLVAAVTALAAGCIVAVHRLRQTRADAAAASREQQLGEAAAGAVLRERAQVARELHDVVSHSVGVVALHAAAAELSWPDDPRAVRDAVAVMRRTTEETLADLGRLPIGPGSRPQSAADLTELVERVRLSGTTVTLDLDPDLDPDLHRAPVAHGDVVYRIVQEGLTNALRHAPGATVAVHVGTTTGADCVTTQVTVLDDGPGPSGGTRRGHGLVGLRERVELVGGSFASGPGPGGRGFRLMASVPQDSSVVAP